MARADQLGFFDKHAEKIALGVAAVVMLAVLILRVVSSPHSSKKIGFNPQPVSPSEMDSQLQEDAMIVRNSIANRQPEQKQAPDPLSQLRRNMAKPIGLTVRDLTMPVGPWKVRTMNSGPVGMRKMPTLQDPAVPDSTKVWSGYELISSTNDAGDSVAEDELVAHITTLWDYGSTILSWKDAVRESGATMKIMCLAVQIERQELLSDGQWSDSVLVDLPEGSPEVPDFENATPADLQKSLDAFGVAGCQRAMLNPSYPSVFWPQAGSWGGWMHHLPRTEVSQLEVAEVWPEQRQPDPYRLRMQEQREQARRESRDNRSAPRRNNTATRTTNSGAGDSMAAMMPGMDPGSMMPGAGSARTASPADNDAREKQNEERRAAQMVVKAEEELEAGRRYLKNNEIEQAVSAINRSERLFEMAMEISGGASGASQGLAEAKAAKYEAQLPQPTPLPSLADMCRNGKVQIWAHDTTLKPGKTYRYRLNVSLLNPIFDASMVGQPDAPEPVMMLTTPWSDNVVTETPVKFFVTGSDNRGNAKISIYRMNNGLLRSQKASVKPGDVLGSTLMLDYIDPMTSRRGLNQTEVDFGTGYTVVDVNPEKMILPRGAVGINRKTTEVTLLTPGGQLITRNAVDDKNNEEYSLLNRRNGDDEDYLEASEGTY